ncbi:hypothetical protein QIS74_12252 [Colletotrichum tabaci]|uniref:Uncharacterized protein n=1 Tax=Colletotrichum tabaci TaxID=1209068 RepID=A0AAV9SWR0_9PEZI
MTRVWIMTASQSRDMPTIVLSSRCGNGTLFGTWEVFVLRA